MQGILHIIPPGMAGPRRRLLLDRAVRLEELRQAVDGYIEIIPGFDSVVQDGRLKACVAFCNEEGKLRGLAFNPQAQTLWLQALIRSHGQAVDPKDTLVGTVVIVTGDAAFMAAL